MSVLFVLCVFLNYNKIITNKYANNGNYVYILNDIFKIRKR